MNAQLKRQEGFERALLFQIDALEKQIAQKSVQTWNQNEEWKQEESFTIYLQ